MGKIKTIAQLPGSIVLGVIKRSTADPVALERYPEKKNCSYLDMGGGGPTRI